MMYFRIQSLLGIAAVCAVSSTSAQAQQMQSYSFDQQNRGQIAVAMKQIEDSDSGSVLGSAGAGGTTIVCGGGAATASANNTCIILNESTGTITTDQLSDGDQSASASDQVTVNGETSGADEVLSTLTR